MNTAITACAWPAETQGYTVSATNLSGLHFNVTVTCAPGYDAPAGVSPGASVCTVEGGAFWLGGCSGLPTPVLSPLLTFEVEDAVSCSKSCV